MIRRLLGSIAVAGLLVAPNAHALEEDEQYWTALYIQAPVVEKVRAWIEPQYRYVPDEPANHRFIARGALLRPVGAGFVVWAGYAWTPVWNKNAAADGTRRVDEHRPWQQISHIFETRGIAFANRVRLEERFIENVESVSFRVRIQSRLQYRPKEWNGFGFVVWDELFLNANSADKGPKAGVDQNRFGLALQYALSKKVILEPTYILNGVNARRKDFHTALLAVWLNF